VHEVLVCAEGVPVPAATRLRRGEGAAPPVLMLRCRGEGAAPPVLMLRCRDEGAALPARGLDAACAIEILRAT
jgi:hypothetical protein